MVRKNSAGNSLAITPQIHTMCMLDKDLSPYPATLPPSPLSLSLSLSLPLSVEKGIILYLQQTRKRCPPHGFLLLDSTFCDH